VSAQRTRVEVDVLGPPEAEAVGAPEAGAENHGNLGPVLLAQRRTEPSLLVIAEDADALVVLAEEPDGADGVRVVEVVADGNMKGTAEECEFTINRCRGEAGPLALANKRGDVPGNDLPQRACTECL